MIKWTKILMEWQPDGKSKRKTDCIKIICVLKLFDVCRHVIFFFRYLLIVFIINFIKLKCYV